MEQQFNTDISVSQLKEKIAQGKPIHIIDVREPIEYHTFNIGGENIPLYILFESSEVLNHDKNQETVLICQRGIRSETARRLLVSAGYKNVKNLTGGLLAYTKIIS